MFKYPFAPGAAAKNVTAAAASAAVTLDTNCECVRVVNTGTTNIASVRFGTGTQTATATDTVIRPNSEIILYKGQANNMAYISASGTTLQIQEGSGGV